MEGSLYCVIAFFVKFTTYKFPVMRRKLFDILLKY